MEEESAAEAIGKKVFIGLKLSSNLGDKSIEISKSNAHDLSINKNSAVEFEAQSALFRYQLVFAN